MKIFSNPAEKSCAVLAEFVGIKLDHGWKTRLAKWFETDPSILSNWFRRGIPSHIIENVVKKGYPTSKWLEEGAKSARGAHKPGNVITEYPQTEQHMLPRGHLKADDSDKGSYGIPDRDGKKVVTIYEAEDKYIIKLVVEIFRSGEHAIIDALKSNIVQFREQIEQKKRIMQLEKEINRLKKPSKSNIKRNAKKG